MNDGRFDRIVRSAHPLPPVSVGNLAQLIFEPLPHRSEDSEIILSHVDKSVVRISLQAYRRILLRLYKLFEEKEIRPRDTVLLASVPGNNELFLSLLFSGLASFGARVLMPMFMERGPLDDWLDRTDCRSVIYPGREILSLDHHDSEKALVREIRERAQERGLPLFDAIEDFGLPDLVCNPVNHGPSFPTDTLEDILYRTDSLTESLIITTSGSSGSSRLVLYEQGAFLRSCASWQSAGFFGSGRLDGCGFTPLFTHTMGVRALFNAVWSGSPLCLINTEWFLEEPETVRHFLLEMKPQHLTGGPSTFRLLLRMMRRYPELKNELVPVLDTLINCGAAVDPKTAAEIESVFDAPLHNAFGTTETLQVTSTLLSPNGDSGTRIGLGTPLPGVSLGFEALPGEDLFRLFVESPFACKKVLGDGEVVAGEKGFRATGDLVRIDGERIHHAGREREDFFKDGFGVKVPVAQVRGFYARETTACEHLEYFPLNSEPGLAALIFISDPEVPVGVVPEEKGGPPIGRMLEQTNDHLNQSLDPFSYRHHTLVRFAVVNDPVPRTAKGTVSHSQIRTEYSEVIEDLISLFPARSSIRILDERLRGTSAFFRYLNPYVGGMLAGLKMDLTFHRSSKDSLFFRQDGEEVEVLDMTGGYGVTLLGHNNAELADVVTGMLRQGAPSLSDQASIQNPAGLLAKRLSLLMGRRTGSTYFVSLGSTGAEVVEMALHHASLEWRGELEKARDRQFRKFGGKAGQLLRECWEHNESVIESCKLKVVVSKDAFHGHTSGARALKKDSEGRRRFSNLLALDPIYVDDRSPHWLAAFERDSSEAMVELKTVVEDNGQFRTESHTRGTIMAAMFEPVLGEGGIRAIDGDVLRFFSNQSYPLILDEIQCGLGRTGSIPATPEIAADYYLFAKALGGGIEKIGALLVESTRFQRRFNKHYSSTFSGGGLAATVAAKTIEILEREDVPGRAKERGKRLRAELDRIQRRYPNVISSVTGRGLMQGVSFAGFRTGKSIILRIVTERKMLGYLFSSYLLNRHQIRILPSLSAANVLRVEPSAFITDEEIRRFGYALEDLARTIQEGKLYDLFKHLMEEDQFPDNRNRLPPNGPMYPGVDPPLEGATQVAFIAHFAYPVDELRMFEEDLCRASDTGLRILSGRLQPLLDMEPVTVFKKNIFGGRIHIHVLTIPLDSAALERRHREGQRRKIVSRIQKAVNMAVSEGAEIVSLGGYTSILTNNGMALSAPGQAKLITGNTLTAASGIRRVVSELIRNPAFHKENTLSILGATGNIGRVLSKHLVPRDDLFGEINLVGRRRSQLESLREECLEADEASPRANLRIETSLECLSRSDVIIITTNTNDPIVFPHHIKREGPVLIADNSVPRAVAGEVDRLPNVTNLQFASYIHLPQDPDFVISSYTPRGSAFCCAAEAMLCGLEGTNLPLKGDLTNEGVAEITRMAEEHGFFQNMGGLGSYR